MKKMKKGVALLVSVLLVGTPVGTVRADEMTGATDVMEENETTENEMPENEAQENEDQENEAQESGAQENQTPELEVQESGVQENEAQELEVQENEAQQIQTQAAEGESALVSTLVFGTTRVVQNSTVITGSGDGWNYDSVTNTLHITEDVTIQANMEKIIQSTGDLHITVASGVTLTVKSNHTQNDRVVIYADGNITLDGEGTIDIEHDADGRGIKAGKGITIQGITLNILTKGNVQEIWANGGELVIKDAIVTANGCCMAKKDGAFSTVRILDQSVVDIISISTSGMEGGLRGAEFEFSDCAHVKVQTINGTLIGAVTNKTFKFVEEQTKDFYFRAQAEASSFIKGKVERQLGDSYTYFEYLGANHVDKATIKQNEGQATHTMQCQCEGERKTSITANCSGGTATCEAQAICEVCKQSYGDQPAHNYNDYHVCTKCGDLDAAVNVVVVAGTEKRGYITADDIENAFIFAEEHPHAVLTILKSASSGLDNLKVTNPTADFTIDLNGINNGNYGTFDVLAGKVTIRDSGTGGTLYWIKAGDTGTINLESGTIDKVDIDKNGTFHVKGGSIARINFTDGQLNWDSSTATVGGMYWDRTCNKKMTISAMPKSPLPIMVPVEWDLSKPVAVAGNGISLTEDMLSIDMLALGVKQYTLKPVIQNNQIYARLPLTVLQADDIVLEPVSGFTYDGKAKKPSVTVQRVIGQSSSSDHSVSTSALTPGTDYTVTYKDNVNAGTATVLITGKGCYTGTVERTFEIAKAAPEKSVINADRRTYSCRVDNADHVDLTEYLPKDHGAITAATATADGDLNYSSAPSVAGGVLSYTIQKSSEAASGTITVTVSTTNYEDITIRVPVETKNIGIVKLASGSAVSLQNATLTEGEKLSTLKFNDAVFVDEEGNEVPGTLAFRTPNATPAVGSVDVEWVFQPDNGKTYMEISGMVTITVKAKTTSGGGSSSGGASSGGGGGLGGGGSSGGGGGLGGGGSAVTEPKDDTKAEDTKKDDTKKDDTKKDNTKKDDTKKDNTKKDDTKKDNNKKDNTKKDDTKKDNNKKDNTKKDDTKKDDTKTDNTKKDGTKQATATPEPAGTKLKDERGVSYEVTSDSKKTPAVTYTAAPKQAKETVTIPKTVTVDGTKYKVTSIEANAFAENKDVKQIVVSQNITMIGTNAFADCSKLKTITINTSKLTSKNVADDAFADIADGTVIRVPQKMLTRYQKLFEKKGLSKKVELVAIKNRKNK